MSKDETEKVEDKNGEPSVVKKKPEAPETKTPEEVTQAEIDALNSDIEAMNSKFVSKEMEEEIKNAKEIAKLEATKEFLVNQKIKDLEAQLSKKEEDSKDKEKEVAEKLEYFKNKLNDMTASKAVVNNDNPFTKEPDVPKHNHLSLSNEESEEIEMASLQAMLEQKRKI